MKKTILYFIALFYFTTSVSAQYFDIKGKVLDKKSNEEIQSCSINFIDPITNNLLESTFTDKNGNFSKKLILQEEIIIKVSNQGYKVFEKKIKKNDFSKNLIIKLVKKVNEISKVVIEGTRSRVTLNEDTLVYDSKAYKTHKDATVEDLVKKMPGITQENGKIKAYGEEVKKVTLDGQDFFGDDANIALRNLPAETVDKVEIFDEKSEMSSFTGFNDGNTKKTLNLKTKKGYKNGFFGKSYAGYGTDNKHQIGGNINYFDGDKRFSALGMINDINNLNFSNSELISATSGTENTNSSNRMSRNINFGMQVAGNSKNSNMFSKFSTTPQDGTNDVYSIGFNYNDKLKSKTKLNISYFSNRIDNRTNTFQNSTTIINNISSLKNNYFELSNIKLFNNKFNTRIDKILDLKNAFIYKASFNNNESFQNKNSINDNYLNSDLLAFYNRQDGWMSSSNYSFNSNLLYMYKFEKKGRTFSSNIIFDINKSNSISKIDNIFNNESINNIYTLLDSVKTSSNTLSTVFSYTEPSGKYGQWMFTYTPSISSKINNNRNYKTDSLIQNNLVDSFSTSFKNTLLYNTAGVNYRLQFEKFRIMSGINVEQIKMNLFELFPKNNNFEKKYLAFLPTLNIEYKLNKISKLVVQYKTLLNEPSLDKMQSNINYSSPSNIYVGNPYLNAEYNHSLYAAMFMPNIAKGQFKMLMFYLSNKANPIGNSSFTALNDTIINNIKIYKGTSYNTYINLENSFSGTMYSNYTTPLKFIKSNLSTNLSFSVNRNPSSSNFINYYTTSYTSSIGLMLSSNISDKIDFSLSYIPRYNIITNQLQSSFDYNYFSHNLNSSLKYTIFDRLIFSTDMSYKYSTKIDPSLNQHLFLIGSSIGYKALSSKALEIKLSIFDLLNQNSNITRNITNNTITDQSINSIKRYLMCTLSYNFRKFKSGGNVDEPNPMFKMFK